MKTMKRLFCISIAILLLCASLTACAPQQEEVSELDLIKAEWQRYVIDRTVEIAEVQLYGLSLTGFSSTLIDSKFIEDRAVINEILDIFETLDVSELKEEAPPEGALERSSLDVYVIPAGSETERNNELSIRFIMNNETTEVYLRFVADGSDYWAHVSEWPVFFKLISYGVR